MTIAFSVEDDQDRSQQGHHQVWRRQLKDLSIVSMKLSQETFPQGKCSPLVGQIISLADTIGKIFRQLHQLVNTWHIRPWKKMINYTPSCTAADILDNKGLSGNNWIQEACNWTLFTKLVMFASKDWILNIKEFSIMKGFLVNINTLLRRPLTLLKSIRHYIRPCLEKGSDQLIQMDR